ncbi:MAG TPA: beta-1,3-glucanase family protein [Pyrinomonadaceae bacterium]|jgi:hypothetical protein
MQVKFVNASKDTWFAYYGLDPANGTPIYLDAAGKVVPSVPSTKPTDAFAIKVTSAPVDLPMMNAARLYVSSGGPLLFPVGLDRRPLPPMPGDTPDPNYHTPWDFFEITYVPAGSDGLFNVNLSVVQSANLPLSFHIAGTEPSTRKPVEYLRGWLPGGYGKFLADLRANPDFSKLILPDTQRVLAPGTAITAFKSHRTPTPLFDADYLKEYTERVWDKFKDTDLTFVGDPPVGSPNFVTWTGRVQNDGKFKFTTSDLPNLEPIVLNVPTTQELFENTPFCASGCGEPHSLQQNYANQLLGTLYAAFNRSVMLTTTKLANAANSAWCMAKEKFYQDPTTNYYSKAIHANTLENLAYAFQSDDHCDQSSFVSVHNPDPLTITFVDSGQ